MKRKIGRAVPLLLGVGAIAAGTIGVALHTPTQRALSERGGGSYPVSRLSPSPPALLGPTTLPTSESHFDVGLKFESPGDLVPKISADQAIATAGSEVGQAETKQAILALLPAGGNVTQDLLVWIVRFDNACYEPPSGGAYPAPGNSPGPTLICGREFDVLIDANSGDYITSYTDR